MSYNINLTKEAQNHFDFFYKHDKSIIKKINNLIENAIENPRKGIGKPERLKYKNEELYSRRINKYHRMVYKIDDDNNSIIIISFYGHYDN